MNSNTINNLKIEKKKFDVVVCGGGMGGVCAAIAAARQGMQTALIQDRSVLGGNASSEVRVHIGGVPEHGYHYDGRESGILEELRLDIAVNDPLNTYSWIDTILYTYCKKEANLSLFLNTSVYEVESEFDTIKSVLGLQLGTEKRIKFEGKIFVDSTGDGTIGFLAGAEYRIGRESQAEFDEELAPKEADNHTLGASILFRAEDRGFPILYHPPDWAITFSEESLRNRKGFTKSNNHEKYWHPDTNGWWWVEYGGLIDSIHDNEEIRFHLQAIVYGIWDYVKNKDPHWSKVAKNFELTWIGQVPGKRESRRLIGDVILTEKDLIQMKKWDDQIAVGGWSIDQHPPEGFYSKESGAKHAYMELPYSIPFRAIYSKNINNLLIGSRCISTSHVAHASTRLIATLAIIGQAAGTAASFCVRKNYFPRDLYNLDIHDLQQVLLKEDQYLLGIKNQDPEDLALKATISTNSELACKFANPEKFIPLFFPMAQRFYLPENNTVKDKPIIGLLLKNNSNEILEISGGIRRDENQLEFKGIEDLAKISGKIEPNCEKWIELQIESKNGTDFIFNEGGNYWIYLDECEDLNWGLNTHHWPGFRMGYFYEPENKWLTVRPSQHQYYDEIIGPRGTFCFQIANVPSPFPINSINNGEHRPFISPNLWISSPIRKNDLKTREEIINSTDIENPPEILIKFKEPTTIREIWFSFDTDLDNCYPHQNYSKMKIKDWPIKGKAPSCIRNLEICNELNGARELIGKIENNHQRKVKYKFGNPITLECLIIVPQDNWGFRSFNIYEIRIY